MNAPVTAEACANIAFIKYWGNLPEGGNLPLNPSISMTMASCVTRTTIEILPSASADECTLDGSIAGGETLRRIAGFLDAVRGMAGRKEHARVGSTNRFPTSCGIASSASGFAALALAAATAYGLQLDKRSLSRLARLGSGSAARSVFGGFVELRAGTSYEEAFAEQVALPAAWPELRDVVVVVSDEEKRTSSADGHRLAHTSEMYAGRLAAVPERAERVRRAVRERDILRLGEAVEEDALSMHAVMMTSKPPLMYWNPDTVGVIRATREIREHGLAAYFTIDAGPNVHILTLEKDLPALQQEMASRFGPFRMIVAAPGPGARLVEAEGR